MSLRVWLEILRPFNCLMAGAAAIIGLLIAGGFDAMASVLIFLSVFLITGAGNAVNDYYDRDIDAVNRPDRPIPSKRIGPAAALNYSLLLFAAGCILAGLVNQICLAVAALNSVLLFFYARNFKATPLVGNLCVAYLTGSTFLFGGAAQGISGMEANLVPAGLSFLATMSREIAKDIEDMEGDRKGGAKTLPILAGEKISAALAAAFALAGMVLSYLPPFGTAYLLIVTAADLFLLSSVWKIIKGDASGSQKALKMGMAVALLAFLAAALAQAQNAYLWAK
jgi:geranylgeranylglycerol-phosphate geranylgeranyltransferase